MPCSLGHGTAKRALVRGDNQRRLLEIERCTVVRDRDVVGPTVLLFVFFGSALSWKGSQALSAVLSIGEKSLIRALDRTQLGLALTLG